MYEELNNMFPNQTWFYDCIGITFEEACDRTARLTGYSNHCINWQGRIIFASTHEIGNDNPWLVLIGGPVINEEITAV